MQNQEFLKQQPITEILSDHAVVGIGFVVLTGVSHWEPVLEAVAELPWALREIGESMGHPGAGLLAYMAVEAFLRSKTVMSRNTKILAGATAADAVLEVGLAKYSGESIRGIVSSTNILENLKDYLATLSGIGIYALDKLRLRRKQSRA